MQLTLPVRLAPESSFASFATHAGVAGALAELQPGLDGRRAQVFLHGPPGSGRSHLLQACCLVAQARAASFVYLPMADLPAVPPSAMLDGLESGELVCLDDLDAVAGQHAWEEALFHFFNRLQAGRASLLVAARWPPGDLALQLPDLVSRLQSMLVLRLVPPGDEDKPAILAAQARARGLVLEAEVARYILARAPRDLSGLVAVLDRLDTSSLAAGRRLSIPFVREAMGWQA